MEWIIPVVAALVGIMVLMSVWARISKKVNRATPAGQGMLAVADHYGFNHGTDEDTERFIEVFGWMTKQLLDGGLTNERLIGSLLAKETVDSRYPMAVDAAWAVGATLPIDVLNQVVKMMGYSGHVKTASIFGAMFPGKQRSAVNGHMVLTKVSSGAVAGTLLIALGTEIGLVEAWA